MNVRLPIALLALSLAAGTAFAAAPYGAPAPTQAKTTAPVVHKVRNTAHHAPKCKAGEVAVNNKCEAKKA